MPTKKPYYEKKTQPIEFHNAKVIQQHLTPEPHMHRELELIYMLDGEVVSYADAAHDVLCSGDLYLSFPNQIHFYDGTKRSNYILFIISPDLLPDFEEVFRLGVPESPIVHGASENPRIRALLELLYAAYSGNADAHAYNEQFQKGCFSALIAEILSMMTIIRPSVGDSGALRTVVSYCMQHFSENLSLSALEEQLHLNKYYISHLFSSKLGLRFTDYVSTLRISEAKKLLINTDMSVTDICETVGFNTLRTFNRTFIKQTGSTPSEYRTRKRKKLEEQKLQNAEQEAKQSSAPPARLNRSF